MLLADERRIVQVFINLLTNAGKFTLEGGQVSFSAKADPGHGMVFTIKDNGIGIASKDISKVVKPFEQTIDSLSTPQEGIGLGLALCNSLVKLHNATMEIESELNVGTTVTVRFPPERTVDHA